MKHIILTSLVLVLLLSCKTKSENKDEKQVENTIQKETKMETLKVQLDAKKAEYAEKWSGETLAVHENGIDVVEKTGITESAVQVGQKAPDFTLNNALGKGVKLSEVLNDGPVVLT